MAWRAPAVRSVRPDDDLHVALPDGGPREHASKVSVMLVCIFTLILTTGFFSAGPVVPAGPMHHVPAVHSAYYAAEVVSRSRRMPQVAVAASPDVSRTIANVLGTAVSPVVHSHAAFLSDVEREVAPPTNQSLEDFLKHLPRSDSAVALHTVKPVAVKLDSLNCFICYTAAGSCVFASGCAIPASAATCGMLLPCSVSPSITAYGPLKDDGCSASKPVYCFANQTAEGSACCKLVAVLTDAGGSDSSASKCHFQSVLLGQAISCVLGSPLGTSLRTLMKITLVQ